MPVLTLQRDPHILERGQMRKYRRNLERAHQAEACHIGWRQRRNILALVQDLTRRRLQELGQEVEACRLAGAVWTDQRMDAATADPKANVANGKETREFLGQSVGFENELISQSNSPISHRRDAPSRQANLFSPAGSPVRLGIRLGKRPPPRWNMPPTALLTQGVKAGIAASAPRSTSPLVEWPARSRVLDWAACRRPTF